MAATNLPSALPLTENGVCPKTEIPVTQLPAGSSATIVALHGGSGFQRRLRSVGIREGKTLRMVASHPFAGPLVIEVDRKQITLGRGMAQRVAVVKAL
jgi:ferrous iron transport protein A